MVRSARLEIPSKRPPETRRISFKSEFESAKYMYIYTIAIYLTSIRVDVRKADNVVSSDALTDVIVVHTEGDRFAHVVSHQDVPEIEDVCKEALEVLHENKHEWRGL